MWLRFCFVLFCFVLFCFVLFCFVFPHSAGVLCALCERGFDKNCSNLESRIFLSNFCLKVKDKLSLCLFKGVNYLFSLTKQVCDLCTWLVVESD